MTDAFECNKKEAIYVTHIKPKKLIPDNFIPEFLKKEEKMKEYIFLIDRSGSMSGSLMKQAKHCLMVRCSYQTNIMFFSKRSNNYLANANSTLFLLDHGGFLNHYRFWENL